LTENGLSIGGAGRVVDWLVVMRRLDERLMLDAAIGEGSLTPRDLDRLAKVLADFYRHARHVPGVPVQHVREWKPTVASSPSYSAEAGFALADVAQGIECA
jgi:aminoglycoside phosphotransferase family enzyme